MKIFGLDIEFRRTKSVENVVEDNNLENKNIPKKRRSASITSSVWGGTWNVTYDGEKNAGEIGPVLNYTIDFLNLSNRSWQAYLDSDVAKTVADRFAVWVVDKGLKLQINPEKLILKSEGIDFETEDFNNIVESRFKTWMKSKHASYSGEISGNETSKEVFKNAKVGGDILVILRYQNGTVTIQMVDGRHVKSPFMSVSESGNKIINGIEVDKKGRHVAYHVQTVNKFERVKAIEPTTGLRTAFLVYGNKYRIDDNRGLPKIAVSLETTAKLDRYKEATVGSAEERAKIAYSIEHNQYSDGENPIGPFATIADNFLEGTDDKLPYDEEGKALAKTVTSTTGKQTFNMPIGSQLKALESKAEVQFSDFFNPMSNIICAAMNIPPNVAFSLYTDSFSASRAATKDWDHTIEFERDYFNDQYFSRVFEFWFYFEVLNGKIQAPGYLEAVGSNNWMITEAYRNIRFTGPMFPHIDPVKEVEAERRKLGSKGSDIPLTTVESATERVGSGESTSNMEQFAKELQKAEDLGISEQESIPDDPANVDSQE